MSENNYENLEIYGIIASLTDMVENSPSPRRDEAKRIIDIDDFYDIITDLKSCIPTDIRRADKINSDADIIINSAEERAAELTADSRQQADSLIEQAHNTADQIIEKGKTEYERLVNEEDILIEAQRRAKLLALKAEANAEMVFENGKTYADSVLADLESFLAEYAKLVANNRKDLGARPAPQQQNQTQQQPVQNAASQQAAPQNRVQRHHQPQPQGMQQPVPQQQPVEPRRARKVAPVPVEDEEMFDEDGYQDEGDKKGEKGGLFGWLKPKRKAVEEDDFVDDDVEY